MTRTVQLFSDLLSSRIEGCLKPTIFVTNSPYEVPRGAATRIQPATWRNSFSANDASRVFPNRHPFRLPRKPNRFLRPGFARGPPLHARARAGRYFLRKYLHSSPRLRALRPERVGVGAPTPTPRPTYWTARRRDRSSLRTAGSPPSVTSTARGSLPGVSRMALPAPPYLAQSAPAPRPSPPPRPSSPRVALICSRSSAARAAPSGPVAFRRAAAKALASAAGSERPEEAPTTTPPTTPPRPPGMDAPFAVAVDGASGGSFANASSAAAMILTSYRWKGVRAPRVRARARLLGNTRRRRRRRTPR